MIKKSELIRILNDTESYHIERTSARNGEAIFDFSLITAFNNTEITDFINKKIHKKTNGQ